MFSYELCEIQFFIGPFSVVIEKLEELLSCDDIESEKGKHKCTQ